MRSSRALSLTRTETLIQETKECQTEEKVEVCTTRGLTRSILAQCGCLPLSMKTSGSKVPTCLPGSGDCISTASQLSNLRCPRPCEGTFASVVRSEIDLKQSDQYEKLLSQYEKFKQFHQTGVTYPNKLKGWECFNISVKCKNYFKLLSLKPNFSL